MRFHLRLGNVSSVYVSVLTTAVDLFVPFHPRPEHSRNVGSSFNATRTFSKSTVALGIISTTRGKFLSKTPIQTPFRSDDQRESLEALQDHGLHNHFLKIKVRRVNRKIFKSHFSRLSVNLPHM